MKATAKVFDSFKGLKRLGWEFQEKWNGDKEFEGKGNAYCKIGDNAIRLYFEIIDSDHLFYMFSTYRTAIRHRGKVNSMQTHNLKQKIWKVTNYSLQ
jgi:hypothetical protein